MGLFQEKILFSYTRCSGCGLRFAPVFFSEKQLQELYSDMPPNMDLVPSRALRQTQRAYFECFSRHLPSGEGAYMEIGPDVGLFTENCIGRCQFDRYWLFEPNEGVKPQLDALMAGTAYSIRHETSDFSVVGNDSVAACVMIHVLDHLLDPKGALLQLHQKMKKGSTLLIVTHNERSLLAKALGSKWPAYCLQHPQLFNFRSIRNLLEESGFRVTEQVKTKNYFPVSFLIKNLLWSLRIRTGTLPQMFDPVISLKLGNMLTLATPK